MPLTSSPNKINFPIKNNHNSSKNNPNNFSTRLDILAVKKAVERYEKVAGAKINFDKSEGLRLGAWRGGVSLPGPSAVVTDPSAFSGCSGPAPNWSEISRRYELR